MLLDLLHKIIPITGKSLDMVTHDVILRHWEVNHQKKTHRVFEMLWHQRQNTEHQFETFETGFQLCPPHYSNPFLRVWDMGSKPSHPFRKSTDAMGCIWIYRRSSESSNPNCLKNIIDLWMFIKPKYQNSILCHTYFINFDMWRSRFPEMEVPRNHPSH